MLFQIRHHTGSLALVGVLTLAGFGGAGLSRAASSEPQSTAALFTESCAGCHGQRGDGGSMGPSLLTPRAKALSRQKINQIISSGRPDMGMPAFEFTHRRDQIQALAIHVLKLQGRATGKAKGQMKNRKKKRAALSPAAQASVNRGRQIFFNEAQCSECHSVFNLGGRTAPQLNRFAKRKNRAQVLEAIVNPSAQISRRYQTTEIVMRDGTVLQQWSRNIQPETLELYDPEHELWTTYFKANLKSVRTLPESSMPANLLEPLTEAQQEDLLNFLMTLK
ncbi:MAG: c-type cytochrome [Myxococcota bacterium]|nr:c-type cytochrome [Myxococcota bacterium]